jgi:hypothetical protein
VEYMRLVRRRETLVCMSPEIRLDHPSNSFLDPWKALRSTRSLTHPLPHKMSNFNQRASVMCGVSTAESSSCNQVLPSSPSVPALRWRLHKHNARNPHAASDVSSGGGGRAPVHISSTCNDRSGCDRSPRVYHMRTHVQRECLGGVGLTAGFTVARKGERPYGR